MNYNQQLIRIRRFLRDPDANIWENSYLKTSFNIIQYDIQNKTRILEDVSVLRIPPFYQFSYMFDWEYRYLPDGQNFHQVLRSHQFGNYVCCNRWEIQTKQKLEGLAIEPGSHFTQPWESWYITPGEVVTFKFPHNFHSVKVMSYDYKEPLPYIDKKDIMSTDATYIQRTSEPNGYYRDDTVSNEFILYPRPSTIVWNDIVEQSDPDFVYTFSFESTGYIDGAGAVFVRSNTYQYVFSWEDEISHLDDIALRGMFLFERAFSFAGQVGMVLYVEGDITEDQIGTWESRTETIFNQDEGIAVDVIDAQDNILLIYDSNPSEIQNDNESSQFPNHLQKYIEYGVLERAYNANTDGRIKSLKDYWAFRYEMGIEAIKRYMVMRRQDRDYRFVTSTLPAKRTIGRARLPDTYPAIVER